MWQDLKSLTNTLNFAWPVLESVLELADSIAKSTGSKLMLPLTVHLFQELIYG